MKRIFLIQAWVCFGILLANFIAQVVYFYHLYYSPQHPFPNLTSSIVMGSVFAFFLVSTILFMKNTRAGKFALLAYLTVEFLFYLWNIVGGARHGLGWFFHLSEPDPILWVVFAIGYLSFFASGYFLILVVVHLRSRAGE
jgi:hypothetical protein